MKSETLSAEEVRGLLDYNPDTGQFKWRHSRGHLKAGSQAGSIRTDGYWAVKINGTAHYCHRLAWLFVHGYWPAQVVRHLNEVRADNRIVNLELAIGAIDDLTVEEVRSFLNYSPDTGMFSWKIRAGAQVRIGDTAGSIGTQGYVAIHIKRKMYGAHRLAWIITHGEWPKNQIDHIDHDRANNRLDNLREVSHRQNHMNKGLRRINTSGATGVSRHAGKWQARIGVNGQRISLGHFESLEEARHARAAADAQYGFHENHGKAVCAK